MQDYEKLGLFYLGRSYDPATRTLGEDLTLYDSRDLVTHAVCVGMTGSGKTGLCLSLLEEAAIDHVPAIAIDPKGDLSNLLLTFPQLRGDDFTPWVDEGEARKQGLTPAEFGEQQAALWKSGLADWGQDGARIQRLRDSAEFRIYTPGSQAGLPLSILHSFAAPPVAIREDSEALSERIGTTAVSLLGLLGIDADPMQSREHILISNILSSAWKAGTDLELSALIPQIQNPHFSRVGVIDLESFFPAKERFALAMKLNNLLASPGFESWLKGDALDIDSMLHAPSGKPRISIISIAHLGETERMFFVALLLNQILGWVRTQSGTSSLRALLYMDEIYGYFPPVATPPSKRPLLTLLKQARAYGLGIILATQNPADLDYKGLSNTGTWFLGRLQAERDKLRVLEGLEGAAAAQSAAFDRSEMDKILSGLGKRTFLMHNVHEDQPQVFQVRWALSYLRGPLTRQQIKQLMDPVKTDAVIAPASHGEPAKSSQSQAPTPAATVSVARPLLPPEVSQYFVPIRGQQPEGAHLVYRPAVFGSGEVYYNEPKAGIATTEPVSLLTLLADEVHAVDWTLAARVDLTPGDLEKVPAAQGRFEALPPSRGKGQKLHDLGQRVHRRPLPSSNAGNPQEPGAWRVVDSPGIRAGFPAPSPAEGQGSPRRADRKAPRPLRPQAGDARREDPPRLAGCRTRDRPGPQRGDRQHCPLRHDDPRRRGRTQEAHVHDHQQGRHRHPQRRQDHEGIQRRLPRAGDRRIAPSATTRPGNRVPQRVESDHPVDRPSHRAARNRGLQAQEVQHHAQTRRAGVDSVLARPGWYDHQRLGMSGTGDSRVDLLFSA